MSRYTFRRYCSEAVERQRGGFLPVTAGSLRDYDKLHAVVRGDSELCRLVVSRSGWAPAPDGRAGDRLGDSMLLDGIPR